MARRSLSEQLSDGAKVPWWVYLVSVYPVGRLALEFGRYTLRTDGWEQAGNAAVAVVAALAVALSVLLAGVARREQRQKVDS